MNDRKTIEKIERAEDGSELVHMDGESNHVHLLMNDPPKVSVSSLVKTLKGVFELCSAPPIAANRQVLLEECSVVAFLFRCILRRRATRQIKRYIEQQTTPL
jgi:putative transposase